MTALTPREIDAALAEKALGCKVVWPVTAPYPEPQCGCHGGLARTYPHGFILRHYNPEEATWETSGQLIEGLTKQHGPEPIPGYGDGWHFELECPTQLGAGSWPRARFWRYTNVGGFGPVPIGDWVESESIPKAIALAACRALGIEVGE